MFKIQSHAHTVLFTESALQTNCSISPEGIQPVYWIQFLSSGWLQFVSYINSFCRSISTCVITGTLLHMTENELVCGVKSLAALQSFRALHRAGRCEVKLCGTLYLLYDVPCFTVLAEDCSLLHCCALWLAELSMIYHAVLNNWMHSTQRLCNLCIQTC